MLILHYGLIGITRVWERLGVSMSIPYEAAMIETSRYLVVIFYSLRKTAWKLWLREILALMRTSFKGAL